MGVAVHDATVSFSVDGGAPTECQNLNADIGYVCGDEISGHFVITAVRGAATASVTVDVDRDSCHVLSEKVTIKLPPS